MKWDLFNPHPEFNYTNMATKLDIASLENPYIQVIWEDVPENFTQERIKSVKQYFMKKYVSNNINVITKAKTTDETQQTIDVAVNIMDKNYQKELIKSLLESKTQDQYYDQVMNIDLAVENRMSANEVEVTPFKRWYIKKIEFSNFLSYGENQVIDFDKCDGITVVESDPPNFGGKTVLTVDLLLFLFFNTTTKTQKAEEIFNRFTDKNSVSVKGDIIIDGEEYIIARKIERKKAKSGEWNVKTELDFFKKLADGQLQNFTGEQRRETENFIKTSIGDMDDFLMTIVTTASNLEDLLEAKPTARGQVLSRFLGLEFLKKKEETGKEIYSEFSKGMLSNVYNTESLRQDIDTSKDEIKRLKGEIVDAETKVADVDKRLQKGQDYKDGLLKSKFTDLDQDLVILNPERLKGQIDEYKTVGKRIQGQIDDVKIVEPKEFYHEDKHDSVKDKLKSVNGELVLAENKVEEIQDLVEIDDNVIIGGNSAVQQFTRIGKLAMIGGMTGVEKDVIPYGLVTGNRSHLEGINIIGLKRAGYSSEEINGLNQAVKLIFSNVLLKNGIEEAKKFSNFKTVCEVISFLEKSEKRPICRPLK
jgi:DNA repair exonuclease SbcCD ATPase subunit